MDSPKKDRKIVIQSHRLRIEATIQALLHGEEVSRKPDNPLRLLRGSAMLAAVIMIVIFVVVQIADALQHAVR
jgi:hypothetical protein